DYVHHEADIHFTLGAIYQAAALALAVDKLEKRDTVKRFDISHYQATVNYQGAYNSGARFVIIKATEGTTYTDSKFSQHYNGATAAGLICGGYHFARPGSSSNSAQATYFLPRPRR
ncbi:MAG: hypothetical protein Q9198_008084, partial [Flavoplaca austrocitrina]